MEKVRSGMRVVVRSNMEELRSGMRVVVRSIMGEVRSKMRDVRSGMRMVRSKSWQSRRLECKVFDTIPNQRDNY
jgi:hypothetical protein